MTTTRAPCPQCDKGERDKALATKTDERGFVSFCHRCGYTASSKRPILRLVSGTNRAQQKNKPSEWSARAEFIWQETQALRGTIGETYLKNRNCVIPPPDGDLRFLPASDKYPPSLCAKITHAESGKPLSLHFTRLTPDGSARLDRSLLKGHRKSGGVIRLWPDSAVTTGLAIAEGVESALSAAHIMQPVWATIDASNMAYFPVLNGIESLTVYADHDKAGLDAARTCGRRWRDAGRDIRVLTPPTEGHDLNDLVRAKS